MPAQLSKEERELIALATQLRNRMGRQAEARRQYLHQQCYRLLSNHTIAEDVVESTIEKVLELAATYHDGASLKTWMFHIATNECWGILRKRQPVSLDHPQPGAEGTDEHALGDTVPDSHSPCEEQALEEVLLSQLEDITDAVWREVMVKAAVKGWDIYDYKIHVLRTLPSCAVSKKPMPFPEIARLLECKRDFVTYRWYTRIVPVVVEALGNAGVILAH